MDNQYRNRSSQQDYRDGWSRRDRQDEQFSDYRDDQFGDGNWRGQSGGNSDRTYGQSQGYQRDNLTRNDTGYGDTSSLDDYDRVGATRYGRQETTHGYFRGDDFGGQDYTRGSYGTSRNMRGYGAAPYGRGYSAIPPRQYDRDERGFFDRASDELMSWFGDDDAARRRELDHREDHRGRGPSNYKRSNERLLEDACERLTRDPRVDASKIDVTCDNNEVTLNGSVTSRAAKRRAEDIVHDIGGVNHVQNNLRVESRDSYYDTNNRIDSES